MKIAGDPRREFIKLSRLCGPPCPGDDGWTIGGVIPNTIVTEFVTGDEGRDIGPCRLCLTEASKDGYHDGAEAASVG